MLMVAVVPVAPAFLFQGCSPPKRDLDESGVLSLTSRQEIMWFQATVADQGFAIAKRKETTPDRLTETDLALFADMGRRIPWGAKRLKETAFSKGPEFDRFAADLEARAADLADASRAKDGTKCIAAALSMKGVCAGCHKKFR